VNVQFVAATVPQSTHTIFGLTILTTVLVALIVSLALIVRQNRRLRQTAARDQARAERDLSESEERYRDLFENSNDLIQSVDAKGRYLFANRTWFEVLRYTPGELQSLTMNDVIAPESREHCAAAFRRALTGETVDRIEAVFRTRDGRRIDIEGSVSCKFDGHGNPVSTRGIFRDVTARRAAAKSLADSRRRLESMVENADDIIYRSDVAGHFTYVNSKATRLLGFTNENVIGTHFLTFIREDFRDAAKELYRLQFEKRLPTTYFEFPCMTIEGESIWLGQRVQPIVIDGEVTGFQAVARDIRERRELEEKLVIARDAAMESARLKSEFLANVSHEIRTPLHGVVGMVDLLLRTALDDRQRRLADALAESARDLSATVNDILDFSKIEAGNLEIESIPFDVQSVVDGVIAPLRDRAERKGLRLIAQVHEDVALELRGDVRRLRQVLSNLVGNAVKFTEEGEIAVTVEGVSLMDHDVVLRFTVRDTGIGIAPHAQRRLFLPFMQADGSLTRRYGGTGLGLAISHHLVALMRGEIGVESALGAGSTFWFSVRCERQYTDAQPRVPARTINHDPDLAHTRSLRILIAEDTAVVRVLVLAQLKNLGYEAFATENGRELLEQLDKAHWDLILMDCQMPEMDGYEATRQIRRRSSPDRNIPVIALTAHAAEADRQRCILAGMDDYLAKPLKEPQLASAVREWERRIRSRAAEPRRASVSPAVDSIALRDIQEGLLNGPAILTEIIDLFLRDVPLNLELLRSAIVEKNAPAVARAAHALRSGSANLGAFSMLALADQMEIQARRDDLTEMNDLFSFLTEEAERVREALLRERPAIGLRRP
jgi:PAS domain S-box-containing protein